VDEFTLAGLTPVPGRRVRADRVLESPVNFECRVTQILRLTTVAGAEVDTWLTLGEVVAVHIDPDLIEDGVYNTGKARPILRAGRMGDYVEVTPEAFFEMRRPR
jgi:flavin reductase (DIM6/NTAB) family NADH-FMN oxidoreductase RutF